jgi:hypothetical protein
VKDVGPSCRDIPPKQRPLQLPSQLPRLEPEPKLEPKPHQYQQGPSARPLLKLGTLSPSMSALSLGLGFSDLLFLSLNFDLLLGFLLKPSFLRALDLVFDLLLDVLVSMIVLSV